MKKLLSPLALAAGVLGAPVASANHIDFLADAGFDISADDTQVDRTLFTSSGSPENIIGAERDVMLWADLGGYTAKLDVPAGPGTVGPNTAVILRVAPTGADSLGTLRLTYDGQGSAGLGGLDFDTKWDSLDVTFDSISGGELDLRLSVRDTNNNSGVAAFGGLSGAGAYSFAFTRSEFTNVDFTSLDSVSFDFETIDMGVSYGISGITREAVPEPSSTLLIGLAMLGLAGRRRR